MNMKTELNQMYMKDLKKTLFIVEAIMKIIIQTKNNQYQKGTVFQIPLNLNHKNSQMKRMLKKKNQIHRKMMTTKMNNLNNKKTIK